MHRRAAALALLASLALAGCSDDDGGAIGDGEASTARQLTLNAINISFDQTDVQLTAGQDVQFVLINGDKVEHNITVEDLDVHVDAEGGKTAKADVTKAPKAGTYQFHCEYHPDRMKGTVTVS